MIQQTSLQAYKELELGTRQAEVYKLLKKYLFGLNNRMIAEKLNKPINSITPRVKELRQMNLVIEHHKDIDKVTKKTTIFWGIKE